MNNTSWLQQWLENIWYKGGKGKYLLLPLTGLYCAVNQFQYWKASRNSKNNSKLTCPVIVVGNITVGGTGKTPLTVYLVKLLQQTGYKPAIITRGYGGQATVWPQSVTTESEAQQVGDEAVLMASRTNVPVYAGADRMESIEQLLKNHDCDVIISDDGLQHYKMPRDLEIAVIDGTRLLGNELCLPAGPLREKKQKLDECDFVVVNSVIDSQAVNSHWIQMKLEGDSLVNISTDQSQTLTDFSEIEVHAVTGIGNPQRFYKTLEQAGLKLITHSFPDHHDFKPSDIQFNDELPIVITEKDAVKCQKLVGDNVWYLPVSARLDQGFDRQFLTKLKRI